jgi:hypothetical protein
MARRFAPLVIALLVVLYAAVAQAAPTVTIIGTVPVDATIGAGEKCSVIWKIDSTGSGTYQVEVGGAGTAGSGTEVVASNGSGDYSGTTTGTTTVSADDDLKNGAGDYQIYVIATEGSDTAFATTTIHLNVPPAAVTGLLLLRGDSELFLSWDPNTEDTLDHYLVYYATHSGAKASDYDGADATEGRSPIKVGNTTQFTLSGLTNEVKYYVRVAAVDTSDAIGPLSEERSGIPTATVAFAQLQDDKGECFIATAAYGSDHPMVRNLRALRDHVLRHSAVGRWFIRAYYHLSPPLAGWIAHRPAARAVVRTALTPAAWAAGCEVRHPGSISLTLVLMLGLAWLAVRQRRGNGEGA